MDFLARLEPPLILVIVPRRPATIKKQRGLRAILAKIEQETLRLADTPLQPSEKVEKERNVKVFGLTSGTC